MSSKAIAAPIIRHITSRGYAKTATNVIPEHIQSNVLSNKIVVAAFDNGAPVTRVTVAFKAGSRYEPQTELGLAHALRSAAGLSTQNASAFIISRKLSQLGATFNASGDREFIFYTLEATNENIDESLEYLNHIISNQEFRPWELSDNVPRLKFDVAVLPPQVRAVDLLHRAAYRRGLGNSLFISPKKIGSISTESLQHFASATLQPGRCAVAVVGDNMAMASRVAQALKLPSGSAAESAPSKYSGGELRKEMGGDLAHVALAVQGAPANTKDGLALAVAAKALGSGPVTKWGSDNTVLGKAIGNIGPFAAAGFNVSYSDNGLFGVVLSVPKDESVAAVKAAASCLKSSSLSSDAIRVGKNQLKLQVLSEAEGNTQLVESMAAQALYSGCVKSPLEIASEIEQLSDSDISQALAKATRSKLSMGAAGNLAYVPYVDEL